MADEQRVETTEVLWGDVVASVDPDYARDNTVRPVVYEWGGGRVLKRDNEPYASVAP